MEKYTWKNEVEGLAFADIQKFLRNLSWSYDCDLKILNSSSTFWKEKVKFEYTGTKDNLTALREEFELAILKYNLPAGIMSKDYKVESIVEKDSHSNTRLNMEVKVPKLSKIKELSNAIADELGMPCSVEEKSNGFLKGKTVSLLAMGSHKQLNAFKALFKECINEAEYRSKNKPKMR